MNMYLVEAVKGKKVRLADGTYKTTDEGYIVYRGYCRAISEKAAIENTKAYHITPGSKFDSIRAVLVE